MSFRMRLSMRDLPLPCGPCTNATVAMQKIELSSVRKAQRGRRRTGDVGEIAPEGGLGLTALLPGALLVHDVAVGGDVEGEREALEGVAAEPLVERELCDGRSVSAACATGGLGEGRGRTAVVEPVLHFCLDHEGTDGVEHLE